MLCGDRNSWHASGAGVPPEAKESHIQGKVVLALAIDKAATRDIRVLTFPDQALTDSAVAAVSRWHY